MTNDKIQMTNKIPASPAGRQIPNSKLDVLKIFKKSGAILNGHFLLSSGMHSDRYLQCALVLQNPKYAAILCSKIAEKFKKEKIDAVVGPAFGGIIVSYEVARHLKVRSLFTERVDGKMTLRRGFEIKPNEKVLVVEDVITTGGSTKEVVDVVEKAGGNVVGIGAIIDRSIGKAEFNKRFENLLRLDIKTFSSEGCPLCKKAVPITKPGSRQIL